MNQAKNEELTIALQQILRYFMSSLCQRNKLHLGVQTDYQTPISRKQYLSKNSQTETCIEVMNSLKPR